jgi:hypothetical protein
MCLVEKKQIPIFIVFDLIQSGLESMIYHTWGERLNHDAVAIHWSKHSLKVSINKKDS